MDKPKAISIGGLESKIPKRIREEIDIVHLEGPELPRASFCPNPDFIIVIRKFAGGRGIKTARLLSEARNNCPILTPMSWSYVIYDLLNSEQLKKWGDYFEERLDAEEKVLDAELARQRGEPSEEPAPELSTAKAPQVSEKELWEAYERLLTDAVMGVFKPGEKMDVSEFLPIVAEEVGISEDEVKRLLPYLAISGLIDNPVGDTWRMIGSDGFTVDLEPAPKPKEEPESQSNRILSLMRGLGPGPWRSQYAIESEMLKFSEFTLMDGRQMTRPRAYQYVKKAMKAGVVFEQDGEFYITHEDSIKLTPVAEKPEPTPKAAPEKPKRELKGIDKDLAERREPINVVGPPPTVSDDVKFLKGMVGKVEKPNIEWKIVLGIKSIMPTVHWDKLADNTVTRLLRRKNVSPRPIPKAMFTPDEWDSLAWDTIKDFKIETMAPYFTVGYFDEEIFCLGCKNMFTFSASEKKFYFDKELSSPKRCPECRKAR